MVLQRKIYYAPGIISLVGFIFLLPYSYNKSIAKPLREISLAVPKKAATKNDFLYGFSESRILYDIKDKKKLNILLTSDRKTNEKKFEIIRYEARKLKYSFDTSSIILVKFTAELMYSDFFKLLDICYADSIKRFATLDNSFVIFGETPPTSKNTDDGYCAGLSNDVILITSPIPEKSFMGKVKDAIQPFSVKQTGSLATLWLFLFFLSLYYNKRRKIHNGHINHSVL